ncbi:hypothetical protein RB195_011422 [Necator americanus]|uniref:Secreted protein n=1 Tax=Necator americanus TaxID=51031 RepID=A0ABR1D2C4_NECAM
MYYCLSILSPLSLCQLFFLIDSVFKSHFASRLCPLLFATLFLVTTRTSSTSRSSTPYVLGVETPFAPLDPAHLLHLSFLFVMLLQNCNDVASQINVPTFMKSNT